MRRSGLQGGNLRRRIAAALLVTVALATNGAATAFALANTPTSSPHLKRIIGGGPDPYHDTRWVASVIREQKQTTSFCGGSLVGRRYVLTAAHCARRTYRQQLVVRLGSNHLDRGGVVRGVRDVFRYPDYNPRTNYGDLALLKLSRPVSLDPVHLAPSNASYATNPPTRAFIAGWGQTKNGGGVSLQLRSTWIWLLPDRSCKGLQPPFNDSVMVCAGAVGRDTCHGDSGGPLAVWDGSAWELVGVTSYGRSRCGVAAAAYAWVGSPILHRWLTGAPISSVASGDR